MKPKAMLWGTFHGRVVTEWLSSAGEDRRMLYHQCLNRGRSASRPLQSALRALSLLVLSICFSQTVAANSPRFFADLNIRTGERVATDAMCFLGVDGCPSLASEDILALRHGLQMPRIEAVASAAEVIENQAFWDRSSQKQVGSLMATDRAYSAVGTARVDDEITTFALVAIPDPTLCSSCFIGAQHLDTPVECYAGILLRCFHA